MRKVGYFFSKYPQFCELILYKERILNNILLGEYQIALTEDETDRESRKNLIFTENYPLKSL